MPHEYNRHKRINNHKVRKEKKQNESSYDKEIINEIKFHHKKNNFQTALALIEEYLNTNPNNDYVLIYKAMTLFRLQRSDEAKEIFETILNSNHLSDRNRLFAMTQYAYLLSRNKEEEKAIYYYAKVIDESKDLELVARGKLASLYTDRNECKKALDLLNIDGFNNMFLNVRRAKAYSKMGKYYNALRELEKETYNDYNYDVNENLDDKYVEQEINFIKGHAYYKISKFDDALTYLSQACTIKNRDIYYKAVVDVIRIYILRLQLDDAISLCEEVKKQCTSDYYFRIIEELLAKVYLRKNDYAKAEETFNNIPLVEKRSTNLAKIELLRGNFEKAEECFSDFDINNKNIKETYDDYYRLLLIKFRLKKFDEALKILDIFDQNLDKYEIRQMKFELDRIRLCINVMTNGKYDYTDMDTYSKKQIICYDEGEAINHVIDHHRENVRTTRFNDNIDIENLFKEVKNLLNPENIMYDSIFDKYIVKYQNIGFNKDGESIHQLLILTMPNTDNIITMYPCDGTESIFNLEELEEREKPKVKRLSQLEKFNKKYGKK